MRAGLACITSLNAAWNFSISALVPTVIRTCVGHIGQARPMKTLRAAMASMISLVGRFVSSMKQFEADGV